MRYRAECALTDFGGFFYEKNEIVELAEGEKHSKHLIPLGEPAVTVTRKTRSTKKKQAGE